MLNPWDETRPLDSIDYFVDRQTGLRRLVDWISDMDSSNSAGLRIHVVGRRGYGKTSVVNLLRRAAHDRLITVFRNLEGSTALPFVPGHGSTAGRRYEELLLNHTLVSGIVDDLWDRTYQCGWHPVNEFLHRAWRRLSRRGFKLDVPVGSTNTSVPLNLPAELHRPPEDRLLNEMRAVLIRSKGDKYRAPALFLDEAECLVTTPFLKALTDSLSSSTNLPHLLVIATKDSFLELLEGAASETGHQLTHSEIEDIDSVEGKFRTIYLRPYKVEDDQEREDVIQRAMLKVLDDYNLHHSTHFEFHIPSAETIALRCAGHLYLVNLLSRCCFDDCIERGDRVVRISSRALRAALEQCRQPYMKHIDPDDEESGGHWIWNDAQTISESVVGGV